MACSRRDDLNTLREVPLDHGLLGGRKLKIRLVDQATGGWGHINFGGILLRK